MGETLGIARNAIEKAERERDRKERLKAIETWNKEKSARQKKASGSLSVAGVEAQRPASAFSDAAGAVIESGVDAEEVGAGADVVAADTERKERRKKCEIM